MELQLFDLNLLVALDALLTERNVTRAGNRLNLSQSAMSGALARLRHYFDDELLVPVGRQMALTPVAEGLVEPVRDDSFSTSAAGVLPISIGLVIGCADGNPRCAGGRPGPHNGHFVNLHAAKSR